MTTVLKLGGSLLTHKTEHETIDRESLERVASLLGDRGQAGLVLVHGGGSFGHPAAAKHGVSRTAGTNDPAVVADVGAAMRRLNEAVVSTLSDVGLAPVGLSPQPIAYKAVGGDVSVSGDAVGTLLAEGFLPILYGDLVAHVGAGCSILDGDRLAIGLATALEADRVGLCTDVPGVLDTDGSVIPHIRRYADVADAIEEPAGADVTGGLAGKIDALLASQTPGVVFGIDDLGAFLGGARPGTRVGDFGD